MGESKWSWFGFFKIVAIALALATGPPTVVRDLMFLNGQTPEPHTAFWAWMRACFFVACVAGWLQQHKEVRKLKSRLEPRLRLSPNILWQEGEDPVGWKWRLIYIEVYNESEVTVEHVSVRLMGIDPPVAEMTWLPIPLHIKHDNTQPHKTEFAVNPGEPRHIDLMTGFMGASKLVVEHTVSGVTREIPSGKYRLTVLASGKDVPASEQVFEVWQDASGVLQCIVK